MDKAALFFEDYLYEGPDGRWIFSPTASPENSPSNTRSQSTFNSTMSVASSKELLNNLITGSRERRFHAGSPAPRPAQQPGHHHPGPLLGFHPVSLVISILTGSVEVL